VSTQTDCAACFERHRKINGLLCTTGQHFFCTACFQDYVSAYAAAEDRLATGDELTCPIPDCKGARYPDKAIIQHVSDAVWQAFTKLREELVEQRVAKELQDQLQQQASLEAERRSALSTEEQAVFEARQRIADDILTLKCPRCRAAFVDFDGCFALTCGACGCGFCAWCLTDRGTDAHACAAQCSQRLGHGGGYFGTKQVFEAHHRALRTRKLSECLRALTPQVRAALRPQVEPDLADLHIEWPQQL
jgi:hypothetical protein